MCLAAPGGPAGAAGPPGLPDSSAVTETGVYVPGTPCSQVIRDDGTVILVPRLLNGIAPGARVTVRGERYFDSPECRGPTLVIRGWDAAGD